MPRLDLLVTDLMMPAMNGDRLARTLRQRHVGLKVLYVTGFSDRLFAEKVSLSEGDAFLEKPYPSTALEQALSLLAYGHLVPPRPRRRRCGCRASVRGDARLRRAWRASAATAIAGWWSCPRRHPHQPE